MSQCQNHFGRPLWQILSLLPPGGFGFDNRRITHGSFASVQSPFQYKGFHRLLERLENSDQMVVLPREETLPGTGDFSKGTMVWILMDYSSRSSMSESVDYPLFSHTLIESLRLFSKRTPAFRLRIVNLVADAVSPCDSRKLFA
jgi:hypothetical protein